jgi:hypothetical protein
MCIYIYTYTHIHTHIHTHTARMAKLKEQDEIRCQFSDTLARTRMGLSALEAVAAGAPDQVHDNCLGMYVREDTRLYDIYMLSFCMHM